MIDSRKKAIRSDAAGRALNADQAIAPSKKEARMPVIFSVFGKYADPAKAQCQPA